MIVVKKAVNMARKIDKKIKVFGKSRGEEMTRVANASLLGQLPIDPESARLCDGGYIEHYNTVTMTSPEESRLQAISENAYSGDGHD